MKIGIYIIIGVKNQEKQIENVLGSLLFKIMYGKEEKIKKVILTDLDSTDKTMERLKNYANQDCDVKVVTWKKCKDIIDLIDEQ
ncbi:MAG: glycosyltransferase [Clostridia bacterium]|nr:glycosyltransferase [Clostridia bacterium]